MQLYVFQVASYMKAVNDIYDKADFDGIELVNFKVKFLTVRSLFCPFSHIISAIKFSFYCPHDLILHLCQIFKVWISVARLDDKSRDFLYCC